MVGFNGYIIRFNGHIVGFNRYIIKFNGHMIGFKYGRHGEYDF